MLRAILIDPFARVVQELHAPDGEYETIRGLVFAGLPGRRGFIEHVSVDRDHGMWLDEEGLLIPWDTQAFWRSRVANRDFAGRALILGETADGESTACTLPLAAVAQSIAWIDPQQARAPKPTFTTIDPTTGRHETVQLDSGPCEWTYDHQPR